MPGADLLRQFCRSTRAQHQALWCLIALGIVPAVITENLVPFDIFALQFGIDTSAIDNPHWLIGAIAFAVGTLLCWRQRNYALVVLLLPWLAIAFVDIGRLTFQLPTYSDVQEKLRTTYDQVREGETLPTTDEIRQNLDRIRFAKNDLLPLDVPAVRQELDAIDSDLAGFDKNLENRIASISGNLARKTSEIKRYDVAAKESLAKIKQINSVLQQSWLPVFKEQRKLLQTLVDRHKAHRRKLVLEKNALQAKLDGLIASQAEMGATYRRLFDLHAEVQTSLWVSQAYATWYYSLLYKLSCCAIFLLLIWQFSLSSGVYLFTVLASFAASSLLVEAPLSYNLWVVFKFLFFSLIVKAIYLAAAENLPVVRNQSRAFLLRAGKTTLVYYLPFILLIAAGIAVSIQIDRYVDDKLYSLDFVENSDPSSNTRRYDVDKGIDRYFERQEKAAHDQLDQLSRSGELTLANLDKQVVGIFEARFKPELPEMNPVFTPPRCDRFYHWLTRTGNCVEKQAKLPLNDAYAEARDEQRDNLEETSKLYAGEVNGDLQAAIRIAKRDLSDRIMAVKSGLKTQLRYLYFGIDLYTWISALILLVIILKSFLYIFSRIFYASEPFDDSRVIQFTAESGPLQKGSVSEVSRQLTLTAKMGRVFYVNKKYDFANAPPDEVTPQAFKAFFSRCKNRVWHLNRIETAPRANSKEAPYRRIPDNERIIVWTMKPGDEVVFSWKNFVGMSDAVKLKTRYSWHLSSLVFGRMFFVVASIDPDSATDGTLLLVATGNDGIEKSASPSNSPDQLLAWQTTTRFQLLANLNFRNIYRSGIQIKARDTDLAVMHLNDDKRRSGASAFLKYFVVPT